MDKNIFNYRVAQLNLKLKKIWVKRYGYYQLNKIRAKDYYIKNIVHRKMYRKINVESIRNKKKLYYLNNREAFLQRYQKKSESLLVPLEYQIIANNKNKYYTCECGLIVPIRFCRNHSIHCTSIRYIYRYKDGVEI